ncbi:MAG: ComEC/Rec2 family competence protein [Tepidisphaeraceae bacterium]|jgi:competence protein ComEC
MPTDSPTPKPLTLANMLAGRPMVATAMLFVLGIALHRHVVADLAAALAMAVAMLLAALLLRHRAVISAIFLAVAFGTLGQLAGRIETFRFPADHIGRFTPDAPRVVRIEAKIVDPPRLLTSPMNERPLPPRQSTQAEVLRVFTKSGWRSASGRIVVHLRDPHPRLAVAQTVRLAGLLSRPGGAENPGEFDWSDYYRRQRMLASISVPHIENIEILRADPPGLLDRLRAAARVCLEVGFTPPKSTDHALLRALVLGDTDSQLRDIQAEFVRTGTSHHLAISGMHIAIVGGLTLWCLRLLGLRPRAACITALAIVLLYGAVVLPNPPVVRSLLLCMAIGLGMLSRRSIDAVQLLAVSVLAMLVLDPLDLYNAGFQLSFGSVLGLMLFSRLVMQWIASFRDRDIALVADLRPRSFWRSAWLWLRHNLTEAAVTSTVAWLVSAPLIAWHFNQLKGCFALLSFLRRRGGSIDLWQFRPCR